MTHLRPRGQRGDLAAPKIYSGQSYLVAVQAYIRYYVRESIEGKFQVQYSERMWVHAPGIGSCGPGWDEDPARRAAGMPPGPDQPLPPGGPVEADREPVITRPDWMAEEEREAWLDALAGEDEPFDPEEYPDPRGTRSNRSRHASFVVTVALSMSNISGVVARASEQLRAATRGGGPAWPPGSAGRSG